MKDMMKWTVILDGLSGTLQFNIGIGIREQLVLVRYCVGKH